MVQDAQSFEPAAPPEDDAAAARSLKAASSGARKLMGGAVGGSFATLMPQVSAGLGDELQHVQGLRSDATDLTAKGKSILKQALVQTLLTQNTINTIWPPVPADD